MSGNTSLSPGSLRALLTTFWDGSLEIETTARGLVFTMPVSYPDGWQVVLELSQKTPGGYSLSDRGKTLAWLSGRGQNIETDAVKAHLQRLCAEHQIAMKHGVLHRWLSAPLDPTDIHVFAEGLVAISRLDILHDHRAAEENVADITVRRVFHDAGLEPEHNHKLFITKERKVTVDYFVERRRPLAIQIIKNKSDFTGTMEKWGFRWDELRKAYQGLAPVMLYDRNTQLVDAYERHIGETKCELFCGYDETDRIHRVMESIR
jgi:hypothetical protein